MKLGFHLDDLSRPGALTRRGSTVPISEERTRALLELMTTKYGTQKMAVWRNGAPIGTLAIDYEARLKKLDRGDLKAYLEALDPLAPIPSITQIAEEVEAPRKKAPLRVRRPVPADEPTDHYDDDTTVTDARTALHRVLREPTISRSYDLPGWLDQRARLETAQGQVSGRASRAWAFTALLRFAAGDAIGASILDAAMSATGVSFREFLSLRTLREKTRRAAT